VRPLSAQELLHVWEEGYDQPPACRALFLLRYACPDERTEALADLPLGLRDARLLTLREWTFGPRLTCLARCPGCHEQLELTFPVEAVRVGAALPANTELELTMQDYHITFRLPNSTDMVALHGLDEGAAARRHLLERCLLGAQYKGRKRSVGRLPTKVLDAVIRRMADADPQANTHTALSCPACAHAWQAAFDIGSFFWTEIEGWAYRMLRDVHRLATAYGWREPDILALSPRRRQFYLERVR